MSEALPERPDLDQLRRRAKELRALARRGDPAALERFQHHHPMSRRGEVPLAAAQLVIARELGFGSWPLLKAAVAAQTTMHRELSAFLTASLDGGRQAADMFRANPAIARRDLHAATVLGDAEAVREALSVDPGAAVAIDDERGWPPLLYACYSRWHQIHPERASGLAEVARLLLDAGASPNTNDGGRARYRSALKGSVEANNPEVTDVLLNRGANPNPGQPIGEAMGHGDHRCLRLLLAHGARVTGTWALGAAVLNDDEVALELLLEALEAGGVDAAKDATEALPDAATLASLPVVAKLLDAGADPNVTDEDGVPVLRLAVRAGKDDIAARLQALGAADEVSDIDQFIGACFKADREAAERLLAEHPDLLERMTEQDRAVIVAAAGRPRPEAVALMASLGFPLDARRFGDQPLHNAAYHGNAEVVRVLLGAGADVHGRDGRFDSTPLAFATVGSGERAGKPGDWVETVRVLIEAGASREDVWISEKPPSTEVASLLRSYGITPDNRVEKALGEPSEAPISIGSGVMADMARHLEVAHRDRDLDLLGSLLHPEVHWTGDCTNKAQVLNWYRRLLAEGTVATVESVQVYGDAVVLGLSVALQAEGARPAPPQLVYQVFRVVDAQIVDIRGYPDSRLGGGLPKTC